AEKPFPSRFTAKRKIRSKCVPRLSDTDNSSTGIGSRRMPGSTTPFILGCNRCTCARLSSSRTTSGEHPPPLQYQNHKVISVREIRTALEPWFQVCCTRPYG